MIDYTLPVLWASLFHPFSSRVSTQARAYPFRAAPRRVGVGVGAVPAS
jgi:hypothetical protein